jgi:hypothetical protein
MYTTMAERECYAADPANLSMYNDPPAAPTPTTGPCFSSSLGSVSIAADSFTLPLENAVVAARYVGDPASNLVEGNIEGFISTATADMVMVDTPIGEQPLSSALQAEDMDGDGWVFHIAFTAVPAEWTGE